VSDEKRLLIVKMATADAAVYTPNIRNTPAKRYAYTGTTHAVGPVGSGSGEAKPPPEAMELATLAISEGSVKSARVIGFFSPYMRPITARRMASATTTMTAGERKMRRNSSRETILPRFSRRAAQQLRLPIESIARARGRSVAANGHSISRRQSERARISL